MTPKSNSSDGDTKEATETSAVGEKRKAEDSGESQEGSESEEDSETESEEEIEAKLKWGYNSFEGLEYKPPKSDPDVDKELAKKWSICARQIIETQGFFDSSLEYPEPQFGGISMVGDLDGSAGQTGTVREACTRMTLKCIKKYNKVNKKNIKLEEILRANFVSCCHPKYYISFLAKEFDESTNDAQLVEYQAKAVWSFDDDIYPLFCRPSPRKNVV